MKHFSFYFFLVFASCNTKQNNDRQILPIEYCSVRSVEAFQDYTLINTQSDSKYVYYFNKQNEHILIVKLGTKKIVNAISTKSIRKSFYFQSQNRAEYNSGKPAKKNYLFEFLFYDDVLKNLYGYNATDNIFFIINTQNNKLVKEYKFILQKQNEDESRNDHTHQFYVNSINNELIHYDWRGAIHYFLNTGKEIKNSKINWVISKPTLQDSSYYLSDGKQIKLKIENIKEYPFLLDNYRYFEWFSVESFSNPAKVKLLNLVIRQGDSTANLFFDTLQKKLTLKSIFKEYTDKATDYIDRKKCVLRPSFFFSHFHYNEYVYNEYHEYYKDSVHKHRQSYNIFDIFTNKAATLRIHNSDVFEDFLAFEIVPKFNKSLAFPNAGNSMGRNMSWAKNPNWDTIFIWDNSSSKMIKKIPCTETIYNYPSRGINLKLVADNGNFLVRGKSDTAYLWNINNLEKPLKYFVNVEYMELMQNGEYLIGNNYIFNISNCQPINLKKSKDISIKLFKTLQRV